MGEWLSQNWFQVVTLAGVVLSWAVHYGISHARWDAMSKKVDEIEKQLVEMDKSFQVHTNNSDIHVSPTLLQLFNERAKYIELQFLDTRQQFADTRADIQR